MPQRARQNTDLALRLGRFFICLSFAVGAPLIADGGDRTATGEDVLSIEEQQYSDLLGAEWTDIFSDTGTDNWQEKWFLDGQNAHITQDELGMAFYAGEEPGNDADHAVLWTKDSFTGDIKIEYEYTRLDEVNKCVTILYIHATGSGEEPFAKDISLWADRREIPSMRMYFDHMQTIHISYAAFDVDNDDPADDYIRARRYMPLNRQGLKGTELEPDYLRTGLFATDVPHKITIIKSSNSIYMNIDGPDKNLLCHWDASEFPAINEGRIGFRHMYTRAARYRNIKVSTPK